VWQVLSLLDNNYAAKGTNTQSWHWQGFHYCTIT